MNPLTEEIAPWMRSFAEAVRDRDFERGRALFDPDVLAFGTVGFRIEELETLVAGQWARVWPRTIEFDFDYAGARGTVSHGLAVIATTWSSTAVLPGRDAQRRKGRATLVLRAEPEGWRAIHTHFSVDPHSDHDPLLRS